MPAVGLSDLAGQVAAGSYDIRQVVAGIVDESSFFEIGAEFGRSLVTGLARAAGRPVGIVAHDSAVAGGAMDGLAADKQTRFVQLCDTFHLPIVCLVDTTGLACDAAAEADGVLRRSVRALQAMHRASVPVVTLHLGQCQGLPGMATASPNHLLMRFAWPTARLTDEHTQTASGGGPLWPTVEAFGLEEVIDPAETREVITSWLELRGHAIRPGPKHGPQFRP